MAEYLDWKSQLSLEAVFAGKDDISYPYFWGEGLIYLSVLRQQKGRTVLIYQTEEKSVCLTPEPFNCRTRISEYGGRPFWLIGDDLFFSNQDDNGLYHQNLNSKQADDVPAPKKISSLEKNFHAKMFTDVVKLSKQWAVSIVEYEYSSHQGRERENASQITAVALDSSPSKSDAREFSLIEGADFYSNLCVDYKRQKVAWVQWDHPNMPWDESELWVADYKVNQEGVRILNKSRVELPPSSSVCQLCFANNGKLFFSADFVIDQASLEHSPSKNYWNIYAYDPQDNASVVEQVTDDQLEYGYPHWQYGDSRIIQFSENQLLTFGSSPVGDQLIKIDQQTLKVSVLHTGDQRLLYQNLSSDHFGRAAVMVLSSDASPQLAVIGDTQSCFNPISVIASNLSGESKAVSFAVGDLSRAEHIRYPTQDGEHAFAFYYPPMNASYNVDDNNLPPPLIVMVHGGPTARAYGYFDIQKQFWTQRGFAILDVNHRGSSGYGRAYRDALYGNWGVLDTRDIIDGINYLVEHSKADRDRVCIRGKSAGGYAVLCALTQFPDVFKAGACYYGIGNLLTLAAVTHKFEKHYTDRMIGETYHRETAKLKTSAFWQRSPINRIKSLKSAMIVFQGSLDKVVPPSVAHEIVEVLEDLNLPYHFVEYPDEGHGFRQTSNNIDALTKELEFYRNSLRDESAP